MNIADKISTIAKMHPNKKAVVLPHNIGNKIYKYSSISFQELESKINHFSGGMWHEGFRPGQKVLLFVRPSLDFHALVFAVFKLGLIPIFIDPGMGRKNLLKAIEGSRPECIIAEPEVHLLKLLFSKSFKSIDYKVTTGRFPFWGAGKTNEFLDNSYAFDTYSWKPNELSAILFTSGGTGSPKGVEYSQQIFKTQTDMLQELFNLNHEEVDLPGFPLFSLFTLSMGMTSVIPDMDPSKPAKADPEKLVRNIIDNNVTFVAGSPAIWRGVAQYCLDKKIKLNSVKYLVMFGAPVSNELHFKFSKILTSGTTYTPYGATESLPVANISGKEVLEKTALKTDEGKGTCVGFPTPGIEIKIIQTSDLAITHIKDAKEMDTGKVGEIIVKGKVVTPAYINLKEETLISKIKDDNGFWHRIGDLGYLDEEGRLWFCGRKSHRVETKNQTLCSVNCEAIFNHHPNIEKTALVELKENGEKSAGLVVQLKKGIKVNKQQLEKELNVMAQTHQHTREIGKFFYHSKFPVDVRHNIKIDRKKLSQYAQRSLS